MRPGSDRFCGLVLGCCVLAGGCGDDGAPSEGTSTGGMGTSTSTSSSSSSSSSTGDDTSSSSAEDSTTMMPSEESGAPINCGAQICAPELVCVREETGPASGTTTGSDTGSSSDTSSSSGGGGGGGGETMVEFHCRARPEACSDVGDCACAAELCPAASCECMDEGTNVIACVPGPSC